MPVVIGFLFLSGTNQGQKLFLAFSLSMNSKSIAEGVVKIYNFLCKEKTQRKL